MRYEFNSYQLNQLFAWDGLNWVLGFIFLKLSENKHKISECHVTLERYSPSCCGFTLQLCVYMCLPSPNLFLRVVNCLLLLLLLCLFLCSCTVLFPRPPLTSTIYPFVFSFFTITVREFACLLIPYFNDV